MDPHPNPQRSAAQDDVNIDPRLRGTPAESVPIKPEASDDTRVSLHGFTDGETLNLLSDHEGDDGLFVPPSEPELTPQERMLATQRKFAEMHRSRISIAQRAAGADASAHDKISRENMAEITKSTKTTEVQRKGRKGQEAAFAKLKAAFQRKKRAGTLSLQEEIDFMKAEAAEEARTRKIQADDAYDNPDPDDSDDEAVFVSDEEPAVKLSEMVSNDDDDEETPAHTKKRGRKDRPGPSRKKARNVAGTRYYEDDVNDVLGRARKVTASRAAGGKKKAGNTSTPKGKGRSRRNTGAAVTNLNSIMGTDVFGDTAATAGLANQPNSFGESVPGRRNDALKQLIASVPVENKAVSQDKRLLDDALKDFTGHASVKPAEDGNWRINGMRSHLKHYQVIGTAFMRRRENDSHEPRGGLLADQMGLGKTVMMLANIVNGKPKKGSKLRATLIVASPALVTQWAHEIEKHTISQREHRQHGIGHVIEYRAGSRFRSNNNDLLLAQADIVLTTYHDVCKSYPKAIIPPNLVTAKQKDDWWKDHYEKERGILHRIKWLRVVLDEAQAIKNHKSHTSMACRALPSRHNWAITGTPVQNTLAEFYPYFKWVREPSTGSFKLFKSNFVSPDDPDGTAKLDVFLNKFMIRRTHLDTLFDARLLDLPTPQEHTLWLEFNDVERQIYEIVKKRFVERINAIAKQNGLEKQYSHIWTMILRLRQITGHILLVQETICDLLTREDFERLNRITESEEEISDEGASLLIHLRDVLKSNVGVKTIHGSLQGTGVDTTVMETVPMGIIDTEDPEGQTGGKHGLSFRIRKYLDSLIESEHWDQICQRTLCSGCRQPPSQPQVTSCFHIYCSTCLNDLHHHAARRGHDQARCSECGEAYTSTQPCEELNTFNRGRESTHESSAESAQPKAKGKKSKRDKFNNTEDWVSMAGEVLPSAKTQAVKAQVMNWLEDEPASKIIIYTQFLPMIRILAKICQTEKWGFCQYHGGMSHDSREKAILEFDTKPEKQILLASLKCGGLGLNLTMASRVVCLDPWWNSAVEQQAFCRVFRIGQTRECRLTRFVVRNTIDAAMMSMKERKNMEIDELMNDFKKRDVTVHDLMRLFGPVGEDAEGRPFIFAEGDEEDDEGHLRVPNVDEEDEEQAMGNEE